MKDHDKARLERRRVYARLPWLLLIPLGLWIPRFCQGHAAEVEKYYSSDLYRPIKGLLASLTSLFPFSIAEFLLYAAVLTVVLCVLIDIARVLLRRVPPARLIRRVVSIAVMFGSLLILFYATWGLNYFRAPLKERMSLDICERPLDELESLTIKLAQRANQLRKTLPEDASGVAMLENGYRPVFDALPEAYAVLAQENAVFSGRVTRAKAVTWSEGLSWCGITGIYIGFTAEPNVNVAAPAFLLPHAAAHEMAHQLGVTSEDEAEFVGYLACLCSRDASVRYAGVVNMLLHCGNALYDADSARYERVYDTYGEGLLRDLRYQRRYWDAHEGRMEEQATQINDAYLKHNGQDSGVKSYGEVVDMLLAYYDLTDF